MANATEPTVLPPGATEHASYRVGNRLLFENDRVRIWEVRLGVGQRSERHRHQADFISIYLTHSKLRVEGPGERTATIEREPGFAGYHPFTGSFVHTLENIGDTEHLEILV